MMQENVTPLVGKTYSLYGGGPTTEPYYDLVARLVDAALRRRPGEERLLAYLRRLDGPGLPGRGSLKRILPAELLARGNPLARYTPGVRQHLRSLSLRQIFDRRLRTREAQYHRYMLEIELVNRLHRDRFRESRPRLALLPHCLRDFSRTCQAASDGFDYVCKRCSKACRIRGLSELLLKHEVQPYIWMEADFKKHHRSLREEGRNLGILGIACLPELVWGMRQCMKAGIPVVGLPLDANRCARWMGEFHDNSVNLDRLERLLR
ncbi:MAG: DUF116 domain-containing protein [Candidatus Zixiibacteriota bacterium]|nr:MAG: DUF116 domain-containing protein [candidate division Zixibacteria bacterium]